MTSPSCHGSVLCCFLFSFPPLLSPPPPPLLPLFVFFINICSLNGLNQSHILRIPIYILPFIWASNRHIQLLIRLYLDVSPASPTYCVHIWTSSGPVKPLLFQCSPMQGNSNIHKQLSGESKLVPFRKIIMDFIGETQEWMNLSEK